MQLIIVAFDPFWSKREKRENSHIPPYLKI